MGGTSGGCARHLPRCSSCLSRGTICRCVGTGRKHRRKAVFSPASGRRGERCRKSPWAVSFKYGGVLECSMATCTVLTLEQRQWRKGSSNCERAGVGAGPGPYATRSSADAVALRSKSHLREWRARKKSRGCGRARPGVECAPLRNTASHGTFSSLNSPQGCAKTFADGDLPT